jgi:hypothetical protein
MLGLTVSEEESERELNVFDDMNMDSYICISMGGEGQRNIQRAAAANDNRPAHNFTSLAAAPNNTQEYLCFEKQNA